MSGIEVAGVALAVLPLLISAAKHYDSALTPFTRYKRFAKEAKTYSKELGIQRTIFRVECRNLLEDTAGVDHDDVDVVLSSSSSHEWPTGELNAQLNKQLGESRQAIFDAIQLVEQELQGIDKENLRFTAELDEEEHKVVSVLARTKDWKRTIRTKLRLSFSESRLEHNIAALKAHNDNLRTLCTQRKSPNSNWSRAISRPTQTARIDLRRYDAIRKAAQQVYEALSSACTKHSEHLAHFRVEVEEFIFKNDAPPKIKFNLGFTHVTLAGTNSSGDSLWFVVDAAVHDQTAILGSKMTSKGDELGKTLKRQLNASACSSSGKVRKAVRFDSSIARPNPYPCLMAKDAFKQEDRMRRDLCDNLRRLLREPCNIGTCVGVLSNTGQCKHFVYPSTYTRRSRSRSAVNLSQLIKTSSSVGPVRGLPLHDRVGLARRLATAVLQYHTTSWLRPSWRSEDILIFDDSGSDQPQPNFCAPYLNTKVLETSNHSSSASPLTTNMARNPLLFSLGVVLLEIAHGANLSTLRQPIDLQNGGERFQDFFTAQRLAKCKGTIMGSRYHAIVEQCIFPPGDDLNDVKLQMAFHQDVIGPLDELENGFKKLYIAD